MARVFDGVGTSNYIMSQFEAGTARKNEEQRRKNIAAAGQVASDGDTRRASDMLLGTGDIEGAAAIESLANAREDRSYLEEERAYERDQREQQDASRAASKSILAEVIGGNVTREQGAAQMALQNPEMALQMDAQNQQMSREQEIAFAQSIVSGFAATPKNQRAAAMKQMANDYADSITDPNLLRMMTNDDPTDDLRAAIMWGEQNGADVSQLTGELELEMETQARERIMRLDARLELQAKRAQNGQELSPYYAGSQNLDGPERRMIMREEADMLEAAQAQADTSIKYAEAATRFVNTARERGATGAMGGGALGQAWRSTGGIGSDVWNVLGGITEEMIRMTRVPGTGVFTDADARRAERSVLSSKRSWDANETAELFANNFAKQAQGYTDYLRWARDTYGHAGGMDSPEARAEWDQYKRENPLTVGGEGNDDVFENNPDYVDFKTWRGRKNQRNFERQVGDANSDTLQSALDRL